jgi:hypothetical protein
MRKLFAMLTLFGALTLAGSTGGFADLGAEGTSTIAGCPGWLTCM